MQSVFEANLSQALETFDLTEEFAQNKFELLFYATRRSAAPLYFPAAEHHRTLAGWYTLCPPMEGWPG